MIHVIKKVISGIDAVNDRTGKIASFFMPLLIIFETCEVISRYVFGHPTIWITELSAMIFGAFIMLGGGYTLRHGAHTNMDILYGTLPNQGKALMDLMTFFCF